MLVRIRPIWQISLKFLVLYSRIRNISAFFCKIYCITDSNYFFYKWKKVDVKLTFRFSHVKKFHLSLEIVYFLVVLRVFYSHSAISTYIHSSKILSQIMVQVVISLKSSFETQGYFDRSLYSHGFSLSNIRLANRT